MRSFTPIGIPLVRAIQQSIKYWRTQTVLGPITVVTPSLYSSYYLRRELVKRPPGLFNVNFIRIDDLADQLLPSGSEKNALSRLEAAEIIYGVLNNSETGTVLDNLSTHPGLQSALHRTFTDLRYSGDEIVNAIWEHGGIAKGVIELWRSYQIASSRYQDRLDVARAAAHAIGMAPVLLKDKFGQIVLPLIEEPPAQYMPLVTALRDHPCVNIIVGLTGDIAADRCVIELAETKESQPSVVAGPPDTFLVTTPDRNEEIRWVVRNVQNLARLGLKFSQIAIFYDNMTYGPRVDEALRIAGIPVSGSDPSPLAASPEGRFVSGLLEASREMSRSAVMEWLTGTPVRSPDEGMMLRPSRWDHISRNARVTRGIDEWRICLKSYIARKRKDAASREEVDQAGGMTVAGLRAEAREASDLLTFIERLNRDLTPPESGTWYALGLWIIGLIDLYLEVIENGNSSLRVERVRAVIHRVQLLSDLDGPKPGLSRFVAVLLSELQHTTRSTRRLSDGVFVAPIRDAVGTWFDAIHVLGMSEGSYPTAVLEDPLLSDLLRKKVDPYGESLPSRAQHQISARRRYLTAIATSQRRYMLWPRSDSGERRMELPSRWFLQEARRLSGIDITLHAGDILNLKQEDYPWIEHVPSVESALMDDSLPGDEHEYALRSVMLWHDAGYPIGKHFLAREPYGGYREALLLGEGRVSNKWTQWDGNLMDYPPTLDEGNDRPISPTRLEVWARCPFRYFLTYILKLETVEKRESLLPITPLERGSLIHRILERFAGAISGETVSPDEEKRLIRQIAKQEFTNIETQGISGKLALWRIERRRIERELVEFVRRNRERLLASGQRTIATEFGFGLNHLDEPALEVDLPSIGLVLFSGIIDRIDMSDDGASATVIDYKTGSKNTYASTYDAPLDNGLRLQLPVYADVTRRHFGGYGSMDSLYWFVTERGGWVEIHEPLSAAEDEFLETADRIVSGIRHGVFPAHPGDPEKTSEGEGSNCTHCPFSERICPRGRLSIWKRKRGDRSLSNYLSLTGEEIDGS